VGGTHAGASEREGDQAGCLSTPAGVPGASLRDTSRAKAAALLAALLVAGAASLWILCRPASFALEGDNQTLTHPLLADAFRQLRAGSLPVWTAGRWGGSPLAGDPVVGALYPPYYLGYALTRFPHSRALDVAVCLHLFVLLTGTVWLLGILGTRPSVALTTALVLALNPTMVVIARDWIQYWAALSYWPWLFGAAARLAPGAPAPRPLTPGRARIGAAMAALAMAAQTYAGYAQFALYSGVAALLWIVLAPGPDRFRRARLAILLGAAAIGLSAPQVLPAVQMARDSIRSGAGGTARLAVVEAFSLSFTTWPAVLRGTPISALLPAKLPLLTVLLALVGVARRSFAAGFLGATFCVATLLATQPNPLYRLVQAIPPFGFFGGPIKYFYLAVFVAVVLSGLGLESALATFEGTRRSAVRGLLARSLLVVVVAASAFFLRQTRALDVVQPWGARVYGPFQSLLHEPPLEGVSAVRASRAAHEGSVQPQPEPRILALIARGDQLRQVGLNFGALWGVEALNGVGPLAQWRQLEVMEAAQVEHAAELARELAADPLVVARGSPLQAKLVGAGFEPLGAERRDGLQMLFAAEPAPRYVLVAHARAASADEAIAAAQLGRALDDEAVLIEGEANDLGDAASPGDADGVLELTAWRPGALRARVSVSRPTWLVAREPFYRNWRATIDGRSATVRPAGGFFLALLVPSGAHEIELAYHEPGLAVGACIALVAVLALWYLPWRLAGLP